jgi:phospholipid/cholesterol/gamma-HCH transport system permease protein
MTEKQEPPEFMKDDPAADQQPWEPVTLVPTLVQEGAGDVFSRVGKETRESFAYLGGLSKIAWQFARVFWQRPWGMDEIKAQCEAIGVRSIPIAALILFFVGLVFALQFGLTLQTMGAVPYVGRVTSLSIVRELGPVFTALVVGGRVGAGMAAEIGSMRVTEQVDAIRALGADPIKKLVVPRIIACTLMLPLLALFADIFGIIGGMIISWVQFDLSMVHFYKSAVSAVRATDFISGYLKPFFFGFGIAVIGCHEGLTCGFGTEGVGRATTRTVVNVSIMVVLVDFVLTKVFTLLPRI